MKTHARVVVIGGGIVGVSILYHLARAGWADVVLCERGELAAGSTWHAAGLIPLFNSSYTVCQLHRDSVELYQRLEVETEAETGAGGEPEQALACHRCGSLRIARSGERMDELRRHASTANTLDVPFHLVTPDDIRELWPLCATGDLAGGLYHPQDGHVAPGGVTRALASGARAHGAEIYRHTEVTAVQRNRRTGEWVVSTSQGDITCEHIVTAMGFHARAGIRRLFGVDVPVVPVEHQYVVTDASPALAERHKQGLPELAVLCSADESWYMREEGDGFVLGAHEASARVWAVDGPPKDFGRQLLPPDRARLEPCIGTATQRVPAFGKVDIGECINGGICYTPDGNPAVGAMFGLPNVWMAEGQSFGIAAAGGVGRHLAAMIVHGEAGIDMTDVDPLRFGEHANRNYAVIKSREAYERVFVNRFPLAERAAARPLKQPPVHDRHKALNAAFGEVNGWERANFFAPAGIAEADKEIGSYRRGNWLDWVRDECLNVRNNVGLLDLTGLSKYEVRGPGALDMLRGMACNHPPRVGGIALAHVLTPTGGVDSEFTVTRLAEDHFYLVSAAAAERHDHDRLIRHLPADHGVQLRNVSQDYGVLVLAGPRAREVLARVCDDDLSNTGFPWLTSREILVGMAPVRAMRVNFVGELGWELHHKLGYQNYLFDRLMEAGAEFGIGPFGAYAMDSLRLEKSYRMWNTELVPRFSALEAGLDRFVQFDDRDFVGREALERQRRDGPPTRFVTIRIDSSDRDPFGDEPVYHNGRVVGRTTSGGYACYLDTSMALGYVEPHAADVGARVEVEMLGEKFPAEIVRGSPYDPGNERLRL